MNIHKIKTLFVVSFCSVSLMAAGTSSKRTPNSISTTAAPLSQMPGRATLGMMGGFSQDFFIFHQC